jgi:hypothetical protein
VEWKKSSYSSAYHGCVEIAAAGERVLVRDSKDPAGPVLAFTPDGWRVFLVSLRPEGRGGVPPCREV